MPALHDGLLSPYLTYIQYSVPGQPQDFHVEYANTSAVVLQWSGSQIRNDDVESYFVNYTAVDGHMEGAQSGSKVVNASQMYCLLSGLDEYREYSVTVVGVNAVGLGAHSSYLTFQTPGRGMHHAHVYASGVAVHECMHVCIVASFQIG